MTKIPRTSHSHTHQRVKPSRGVVSTMPKPHGKDPRDKYRALDMQPAENANRANDSKP